MNPIERIRIAWIRAKLIVKIVAIRPGYFRCRGIHVFHTGLLLDQPACAEAIYRAITSAKGEGVAVVKSLDVLKRCIIRFVRKGTLGETIHAQAKWSGGFWDVGMILVAPYEDWADCIEDAVLKMILSEHGPSKTRNGLRAVA